MFHKSALCHALAAATLALLLTGCADARLDGGYMGEPKAAAVFSSLSAVSHLDTSGIVYRGGRDPVTGNAILKN